MMSMSGSFQAPGPAISVNPFDCWEASAQCVRMLARLVQLLLMSTQFRQRLQCFFNSLYGICMHAICADKRVCGKVRLQCMHARTVGAHWHAGGMNKTRYGALHTWMPVCTGSGR